MANYLNIPKLLPFWFVPIQATPGVDFDDRWSSKQLLDTEVRSYYKQKWQRGDITKLQIECSVTPDNLLLIDPNNNTIKSFTWTAVFTAINYKIYETEFNVTDVINDGTYFLYQRVAFASFVWEAVTEPIMLKDNWPGTKLFNYTNSFNDFDIAFTATNISFNFRIECAIPANQLVTKRNATDYFNETQNLKILNSVPYRIFKLFVGDLLITPSCRGVAPWTIDLLSRIFGCDSVNIDGKFYAANSGADFEKSPVNGYPLISGTLEIVESQNRSSLQFQDATTDLQKAVLVGYNFETGFFGPGAPVPVIEIQENS